MDLLENEMVRKYFGCGPETQCCGNLAGGKPVEHMALRILAGMQTPIRNGERYLRWDMAEKAVDEREYSEATGIAPRMIFLRLPSRFQKAECPNVTLTCSCGLVVEHKAALETCGCEENHKMHKPADPVEEKIRDLRQWYIGLFSAVHMEPTKDIDKELWGLVRLAMESK